MLQGSRQLLSNVLASTADAMLTTSAAGTITSWNRGAERLYGYRADEAIGRLVTMIAPPRRREEQREPRRKVFAGQSIDRLQTERVRKDGSAITVSVTFSQVRGARGQIVSAALIARDVTERLRYGERLRHLADHDQLTGLFNRRAFEQARKRELARAGRTAGTVRC
jgi:PAS domain S-box-containing protein